MTTTTYICNNESVSAATAQEAAEKYAAAEAVASPDHTVIVTVCVVAPSGATTIHKVEIEPVVPPCPGEEDGHDWKEGPVRGSGGGVRWRDTCRRCGLTRTTDTWGTDPATGSQGHRIVTLR